MLRRWFRQVLMVTGATLAASASAQAPSSTPPIAGDVVFSAWFTRLVELDQASLYRQPLMIQWRMETPPPSAEYLDSLAKEIEGKPVHPQRSLYDALVRTRGQTTWTEYRVWRSGDTWRCAQESWDPTIGAIDHGFNPTSAWSLTKTTLVNSKRGGASGSYKFSRLEPILAADVLEFFNARLPKDLLKHPESVNVDAGGVWSAALDFPGRDGGTRTLSARGTFDRAAGWGTIEHVLWSIRPAGAEESRESRVLTGWHPSPIAGLGVCDRVVTQEAANPLTLRTLILKDLRPTDKAEVERLAAVPDTKLPDPIRGSPTFTQVQDFTKQATGEIPASTIDRTQQNKAAKALPAVIPVGASPGAAGEGSLRLVGWIAAGVIAVTLVVLRVRRGT